MPQPPDRMNRRGPLRLVAFAALFVAAALVAGCASPAPTPSAAATGTRPSSSPFPSPVSTRIVHRGSDPVAIGEPMDLRDLTGRIATDDDDHRDIWLMGADGSNQRRVTSEAGQFVAFSPDGEHLLSSGRALYVVRLDGTGRLELRAEGMPLALGGIPDWIATER